MLNLLKNTKQHLMTGVSYMIPFVVAGGVLLALAVTLSGQPDVPKIGILKTIADIGIAGLKLFVPVMGGFIAFSMVDRPGIAPGMIAAYLANEIGGGFLGGILGGLIAGIIVFYLKKIKVPKELSSVMPIFIIPLVGTLVAGLIILLFVGKPIAILMDSLTIWLGNMQNTSKIILGIILGAMIAFDMGGPLNKVAFSFAAATVYTHPHIMAAVGVAICTPPLGLALATFIFKNRFSKEEIESGKAAIIMGSVGITEGAIPFASVDPFKVIPSIMLGGSVASVISLLLNSKNHAAWGGLIVLPVVENRLGYIIAIIVGSVVTAVIVALLKKPYVEKIEKKEEEDNNIELDITF